MEVAGPVSWILIKSWRNIWKYRIALIMEIYMESKVNMEMYGNRKVSRLIANDLCTYSDLFPPYSCSEDY